MTHEFDPNDEDPGGPEQTGWLPEADQIPGDLSPEESDQPALESDL